MLQITFGVTRVFPQNSNVIKTPVAMAMKDRLVYYLVSGRALALTVFFGGDFFVNSLSSR